jgi:uncharacterized RDD family membrane protein YckC
VAPHSGSPLTRPTWRDYQLASWWERGVALILDGLVVLAISIPLRVACGFGAFVGGTDTTLERIAAVGIGAIAGLIYLPTIMKLTDGRTLGKLVFGLRVLRTDGNAMSYRRAAFREVVCKQLLLGLSLLAYLLPLIPIIGEAIDDLWALRDHQNRAIHDTLARTRVVTDRSRSAV